MDVWDDDDQNLGQRGGRVLSLILVVKTISGPSLASVFLGFLSL